MIWVSAQNAVICRGPSTCLAVPIVKGRGSQIETWKRKSVIFFVRLRGYLPFWLSWPKPLRGLVCYSIYTRSSTHRFQVASSLRGQSSHDVGVPWAHSISAAAQTGPSIVFQLVSIAFEFWVFWWTRSVQHVFMCKEREHTSKKRSSWVASNMCSCARNLNIPARNASVA